ncbi:hypothetical protein ASF49_14935 [Methylobacterium sp. Leaf104]|uniref:hypothetical protein n=1 Tax=Methylobacterium TaxID=407 RepID=UPI0006F742EA|nr:MULTISPECIES: hypothetical protein [Methylobacterium]KQP29964.1 hypothetical protein ASF49_14935 [Methylobacterium sp. Leaf104]MCI9882335.1 hypothetical protein [Methylobacterium goesingense]
MTAPTMPAPTIPIPPLRTTVETLGDGRGQIGETVNQLDQLSSIVLLGLAIVGAGLAVGLTALLH